MFFLNKKDLLDRKDFSFEAELLRRLESKHSMWKLFQDQALMIRTKRKDATWKNGFPLRTRQDYFQEEVLL